MLKNVPGRPATQVSFPRSVYRPKDIPRLLTCSQKATFQNENGHQHSQEICQNPNVNCKQREVVCVDGVRSGSLAPFPGESDQPPGRDGQLCSSSRPSLKQATRQAADRGGEGRIVRVKSGGQTAVRSFSGRPWLAGPRPAFSAVITKERQQRSYSRLGGTCCTPPLLGRS